MNAGHRQIERAAAAWLARRDGEAWGTADQAALQAWLAAHASHRVAYLRLQAAWTGAARLRTLAGNGSTASVPSRGTWADSPYFTRTAAPKPPGPATAARPARWRWPLGIAAAAMLLAVGVAAGLGWRAANRIDRGEWSTAIGAQQQVRLADGSTVTLGSASEVHAVLTRHQRNLYLLRGEALFDVAHDPSRPFVVHTGAYRVTALGTRFDVRRDATGLRVVVTRGVVRLQSTHGSKRALTDLPAGSVARVDNGIVSTRQIPLDQAREFLSWRDGYVVFQQTPLAEAIAEFNRYNVQQIALADPSLGQLRIGGNFRLDNGSAFVHLIQVVFPIRATALGNAVVLSRRGAGPRH